MKKLLAIVISVAMLVAMMPMGVFAETNCSGGESCSCEAMIGTTHYATLEAAIGTVENRNNEATRITLCKNAEIEAASNPDTWLLINNKDIIIDLNGHNINLQKNNYILSLLKNNRKNRLL